jgi:hypothetical protein
MPFNGPDEWCLSRLPVNRGVGVDFVVGVRSHAGEVLSVYLMDADIAKLMEFLSQAHRQVA